VSAQVKDERIVYGATCVWWDSIDKVGRKESADRVFGPLPCCPFCGGVLFELDNEAQWFAQVDAYEAKGHPGYRKFIEWQRGKCFPTHAAAFAAYNAAMRAH
jgi:hypothetical protein